jgi:hypothetical protein
VLGPFFSSPSTNASGSAIIGIAPLPQWAFVGIKRGQSDPPHSGVDSSPVIRRYCPGANAEASYFAPGQAVSRLIRYLFHDPSALGAFTLPYFRPIASDFRSDESLNI